LFVSWRRLVAGPAAGGRSLQAGITAAAEDADAAAERYAERDPAGFPAPRRSITRRNYVDFVRPLAAGFESGPNRGQYGPRWRRTPGCR